LKWITCSRKADLLHRMSPLIADFVAEVGDDDGGDEAVDSVVCHLQHRKR